MPGLSDCLHCPLRDSDFVCPTISRQHPFCEAVTPGAARYNPRMAASVVMIAKGERHEPKPVVVVVAFRSGEEVTPTALEEQPRPTFELTEEQAAAFKAEASACPHRTKDSTCNCKRWRCGFGKGVEGIVTDWDCLGCLGYVDNAGRATEKGKPRETAGPSLVQRIGNATKAIGRVIAQTAHGGEVYVSAEESSRRLAICKACSLFYRPLTQTCEHPQCGCALPVKTKLATEKCPVGKWATEPQPEPSSPGYGS